MKCKLCNKQIKQYQGRGRTRCSGCNTKIRRYRTKMAAVLLMGGKCMDCGWSGNIAAYEFHHKDPSKKSFEIGPCANKSWEVIKKELKKCKLLCSNCHQIEGANNTDKKFLEEVVNYNGKLLE